MPWGAPLLGVVGRNAASKMVNEVSIDLAGFDLVRTEPDCSTISAAAFAVPTIFCGQLDLSTTDRLLCVPERALGVVLLVKLIDRELDQLGIVQPEARA